MKQSFIAILLISTSICYAQMDAGSDIVICELGPVNLSANYTPLTAATNDYTVENIPYTNESFTGTDVALTDDSESGTNQIGFEFCYYGNVYTEFCIGSNGWITFSCGQTNAYVSGPIPDPNSPLNSIMGPWSDWNPGSGGEIKYETIGVAPNRSLVVSWVDVPLFGFACAAFTGKFQIVLRETSNIIENNLEVKDNCPDNGAGGSNIAVQGIQNIDGTASIVVPGRNATAWDAYNESYRYTPAGIVEWFDELGNLVGVGLTTVVNPTVTTTYTVTAPECPNNVSDEVTVFVSSAVATNPVIVDNLCPEEVDASIEISPVGGTNPLSFNWISSNGFTSSNEDIYNLAAGNYNLTITDDLGCQSQDGPFTISPTPQAIAVSELLNPVSCFGFSDGAIAITVSGGTPAYNYNWTSTNPITGNGTGTITNLATGDYTVNITDANNCPFTTSFYLGENTPLNINTTKSNYNGFNIRCFEGDDGWISTEASGGMLPYTYTWTDMATSEVVSSNQDLYNIGASQYQLSVTDAENCPNILVLDMIEPDSLSLDISDYAHKSCTYNNDGFIEIVTWGGPDAPVGSENFYPQNYKWKGPNSFFSYDKNIYNLIEGMYTIETEDINNCTNELTFEIKQNEEVIAGYRILDDTVTINYPIVNLFDNSTGEIESWDWEFSNGISYTSEDVIGMDLTVDLSETGKMYYYLSHIATDIHGCSDTITGTIAVKDEHTLFVPNAFTPDLDGINDSFRIFHHAMKTQSFSISIFDRFGSIIFTSNDPNLDWDGKNQFTGGDIISGVYSYSLSYIDFEGRIYDYTNCENCSGTISILR